ncbi:isochorismatase family protein [Aurantimonas sp. VKM B-3413]|uniref:isochorismatase family protein n=1 Tax=Aurantimonas sp. VKM B-3413 TaxID=2779401 RepID=UPI001E589B9B|nr:isochorismatase family protein [Aurantimonas sp. VKM B-3413]MCB8840111.1 isochorismatase family protein [Aurantimonas sp. VKM B-3413]
MPVSATALLVIDVQESFRHRPYWQEDHLPRFQSALNRLVSGAAERKIPVVQIFHVEDAGPFSQGSGHVRTMDGIDVAPGKVFSKRRHSALVGSGLDVWLVQNGVRRVIVAGIRTEQCCETTTRHLSDLGYEVDFVSEATLTFDMTAADGRLYTADDIRQRTELVLAGRFARILSVDEALAPPAAARAAA